MKGKWAQGLRPRGFTWVIKDRVAASERPGGYARNHRKVRRDEELVWLKQNGFTRLLSLLDSPHNLAAYDEVGVRYEHVPLGRPGSERDHLKAVYGAMLRWYRDPSELVLVHHEEFGDRLCGVIGGFLLAAGLLEDAPTAVAVTERLTGRQLGPDGRAIVRATIDEGLAPRARPSEPEPDPEPEPPARPRGRSKQAARKAPAKKRTARKAPAKKKTAAKKAAPKKEAARKAPAKKKTGAKAAAPKKQAARKAPTKGSKRPGAARPPRRRRS